MPQRYEDYDRVAVVTGSDSGIGESIAVALANAGFDVGITWLDDDAGAREVADKVRAADRRAEIRRLDLRKLPGAAGVVDELADASAGWVCWSTAPAPASPRRCWRPRTSSGARSSR